MVLDGSDDEFNPNAEINQVVKVSKKRGSKGRPRKKAGQRRKYKDTVPVQLRQFLGASRSSPSPCSESRNRAH